MAEVRAYKDRPFRRIGIALLIAVGAHAVVLGAGAYYFRDYVFTPSSPRITTEMLDRAVADAPISFPAFSMTGETDDAAIDTDVRSIGWEQYSFTVAPGSWWSWEPDQRLIAQINIPARPRSARP